MSKVYGYCRCSTDENKQDITRQVRELKEMGAAPETIFTEYISGMKENKVEFQKLLNVIQAGDTLAVTELSRLTRSTRQLCDIIETVKQKQIRLIIKDSITIDCTSGSMDPMTAAFLQITGVFAELERNMISERTKSGMKNARAKGKQIGRPHTTLDDLPKHFYIDYEYIKGGRMNRSDTAADMKISRPTLNKYIKLYSVIDEAAERYQDKFNQEFPIGEILWKHKYSEVPEIIENCLKKSKDVYELDYVRI
jgi:DNA invertase Pin-like site-specific DNA recombinase